MPDPDYASMSEDELNALFAKGEGFLKEEDAPEETPPAPDAPPPEDEPAIDEPAVDGQEPDAPPAPEVDDTVDPVSDLLEGERIHRERLEAALELQKAHGSRLAGEIGHLRKLVQTPRSEQYEPETQEDVDRIAVLEREIEGLKFKSNSDAVGVAVNQEIAAIDALPEAAGLSNEFAEIVPKYRDQFHAILSISDPELARQTARALGRGILADAKELAWTNRRKGLEEKRASQLKTIERGKRAATVSGSGAAAAQKSAPKTYDDMTPEELDREMEKEFGRR